MAMNIFLLFNFLIQVLLIGDIKTSFYNYIEENAIIDADPSQTFSTNSLTDCILRCRSTDLFNFIGTDLGIDNTNYGQCNCYENASCSQKKVKQKWKVIWIGECSLFPMCYCDPNCTSMSNIPSLDGLPCICYVGNICLSTHGPIKNLVRDGTVRLSSTYNSDTPGSRAIDGFYDTKSDDERNNAHTIAYQNYLSWLLIELPRKATIYKVFIVNRVGFTYRLNPFQVFIGNTSDSYMSCSDEMDGSNRVIIHVWCHQKMMVGQFVKLQINKNKGILNIQEMEVYGHY